MKTIKENLKKSKELVLNKLAGMNVQTLQKNDL